VDAERLDSLVNMVGELVIIQSRLAQAVRDAHNPVLAQIAEDMERLMDELSENALSIRMLPFGSMFGGFRRLVRDLAKTLGKPVEFVTEGAETELDKTVIDKLKDPLMHILRNAVDHGLEPSEARRELGKPEQGRVVLSAAHASGEVVITVADDGRGIDPERVRARAVERGLVAPDAVLDEREALGLLFEPGFSTAETVSNISGRGVGMDVVRKSIEGLRGSIDVESTPGRGTRMRIRLPLTLAIIDGLNVRVEQESYILPLAAVEACQERFVEGRPETFDTVERMGQLIPCISLRRLLHVPGEQPGYERIVVVQVDGRQVGLAVDVVVGRQQAVIKSMSGLCKDQDWISGTTINGDGGISLILDVPQLVARAAETTQPQQTRRAA
jgi:two-component system chemotaxis sensor kinase CheA